MLQNNRELLCEVQPQPDRAGAPRRVPVVQGEKHMQLASAITRMSVILAILCPFAAQAAPSSVCSDFDNQTLQGWGGPGVSLSTQQPGETGLATDYYLRLMDQGGTSYGQAPASYLGDWSSLALNCSTISIWIRWFDDGMPGSVNLTPTIAIQNGTLRGALRGTVTITEDGGPNPGWYHLEGLIAPLGPGDTMPSTATSYWEMLDGAPNSAWPTLLSNVTLFVLPVEAGTYTETVGYDDICIQVGGGCPVPTEVLTWGGVKTLIR